MQSVKLNLIPGAVLPVVNVSQYDVKRTFQLAVYDGAASYDLTGKTVTIRGTKPDMHGFDYGTSDGVVSVSGNTVTISTTQQMTAVGGQVMAELRIESGTTVIGTLNFIIDVEPSALSDETIISDTEIPVIERSAWEQVEQAEKWATGAHDGTPVGPSEPQFENSAKWWAQHASTLGGLTDVDIESPTNDQVLKYDSATQTWKNGNGGGGGASALDDLTDVTITSAADGELLQYNSTSGEWENSAEIPNAVSALEETGAVNLLPNKTVSQTINNVAFTHNADDTISTHRVSASTSSSILYIADNINTFTLPKGKYVLSDGKSPNPYAWMFVSLVSGGTIVAQNIATTENGATVFDTSPYTYDSMYIGARIGMEQTADVTFKPMIYDARFGLNVPFMPYAMTNKELTDAATVKEADITLASGITLAVAGTKAIAKIGHLVMVNFAIKGAVANQNIWLDIGTLPSGYSPASYKTMTGMVSNANDCHLFEAQALSGKIRIVDRTRALVATDWLVIFGCYWV